MTSTQFGYWECQGLGQPIRMLLKYVDEPYEDTIFRFDAGEGSKYHWPSQKFNLGIPFPNLPFYFDGNVKLSQSGAILRHLGRKYKMYGANPNEASEIDMLIDTSYDLTVGLAMKAYSEPDFEKLKEFALKDHQPKIKQLSEYLGTNHFMVGSKISIADFPIYKILKWHMALDIDLLDKCENLVDYTKRFESDPIIKEFLKSDKAFTGLVAPAAHWNGV